MRKALGRLLVIAWKELAQLRRDHLTLAMMLVIPVIQLTLFGWAINTDVRNAPTVIYDQDRTTESREMVRRMEATGYYEVRGHVDDYGSIETAFRRGDARVALVVPPRWSRDVEAGRPAAMQLVVDGSDPQTVSSATQTAAALATLASAERTRTPPLVTIEPTTWYNPELRTATHIVPGLTGVILTMTMVMITAMAIARERERGTLEQLIVSPIGRTELMVGKILPYVSIGFVQMTLVLLLGWLLFDVPVEGSVITLYVFALPFIGANLALGLLFSTVAKTQQQAMQMSFFFLLPNILLSGFLFPREAMPRLAQWISEVLPLTHFLPIVRGIVLKESSAADLAGEIAWLLAILVVLVGIASLRFRKKLA